MGGEEDRGVLEIGEAMDQVVEVTPRLGVETCGRLVEKEKLRAPG